MSVEKNKKNQYYVLSLLSNLGAGLPAKKAEDLQKQLNKIKDALASETVSNFTGKWKVVWGPVLTHSYEWNLSREKRYVTDNAMYVAQSQTDKNQYFVGVAGTNAISTAGWFEQDFNVEKMTAWPPTFLNLPKEPRAGNIALGTEIGLKALWEMKDDKEGQLINFLKNRVLNGSTISVGGHSLGGCLSPVLATALSNVMKHVQPVKQLTFEAYPTAGPTPGDIEFANHIASSLTYYQADYNLNDIVPLAWNFDTAKINALKASYKTFKVGDETINPDQTIIENFLAWAKSLGEKGAYEREPEVAQEHFNVHTWRNGSASKATQEDVDDFVTVTVFYPIGKNLKTLNNGKKLGYTARANFARFFLEMGAQHVPVYGAHFNLAPAVVNELQKLFFHPTDKTDIKWLKFQALKELSKLTTKAANWIKPSDEQLVQTDYAHSEQFQIDEEQLEGLFGEGELLLPWQNML